jgi:hypothetical protein
MSDKINAKEELLRLVKQYNLEIIAASITFGYNYYDDAEEALNSFKLKPLYSKSDFEDFLKFMDRKYDSGYGGQKLFGTVYCENGIWMSRGEHDGSEWWEVNQYPDMREHFDEVVVMKYKRQKKLKMIESLKESP